MNRQQFRLKDKKKLWSSAHMTLVFLCGTATFVTGLCCGRGVRAAQKAGGKNYNIFNLSLLYVLHSHVVCIIMSNILWIIHSDPTTHNKQY